MFIQKNRPRTTVGEPIGETLAKLPFTGDQAVCLGHDQAAWSGPALYRGSAEGANKAYKTDILVDEGTFQRAQNDVEGREIDFLAVLGRVEPVRVYQIIAPAGCLSAVEQQLCGLFAQGLAAYRARDWDQSERYFAQCLAVMPTDGPATVFHRRINFLRGKPLPADWDGVWQLTDK